MINQYENTNPNICFKCANAYAHKCEYIRNGPARIIQSCENFVPDAPRKPMSKPEPPPQETYHDTVIAKNLHDIAKALHYNYDNFAHASDGVKSVIARQNGYMLEIVHANTYRKYKLIKRDTDNTTNA